MQTTDNNETDGTHPGSMISQLLEWELTSIDIAANLYTKWVSSFFPAFANDVRRWRNAFRNQCTHSIVGNYDAYAIPTRYDFLCLYGKKLEQHTYVDSEEVFKVHTVDKMTSSEADHDMIAFINQNSPLCHRLAAFYTVTIPEEEIVGATWDQRVYDCTGTDIGPLNEATLKLLAQTEGAGESMADSIVYVAFTMPRT